MKLQKRKKNSSTDQTQPNISDLYMSNSAWTDHMGGSLVFCFICWISFEMERILTEKDNKDFVVSELAAYFNLDVTIKFVISLHNLPIVMQVSEAATGKCSMQYDSDISCRNRKFAKDLRRRILFVLTKYEFADLNNDKPIRSNIQKSLPVGMCWYHCWCNKLFIIDRTFYDCIKIRFWNDGNIEEGT